MTKPHENKRTAEYTPTAEEGKELAVRVSSNLTVTDQAPDDLAADAGAGLQNITGTDLATPLLVILQAGSPQVKRSDGKYIAGAVEGSVYNNVSGSVVSGDAGITVVPCFFEKNFIEWKSNRGGFVAAHGVDTPLKNQLKPTEVTNEKGEKKTVALLPNGNILAETNQHYVLIVHADGTFEPAVIPMASSQLKPSRVWNSLMSKVKLQRKDGTLFTPASFFTKYKLTTKVRTKDQNSWYVWSAEPAGTTRDLDKTSMLYEAGKAFEKAVSAGKVQVKHDETAQPEAGTAHEPGAVEDDGIPF